MPSVRALAPALLLPTLFVGCPGNGSAAGSGRTDPNAQAAAAEPYEDWYPADTTPPPGTRYPCAFSPLPLQLEGIPPQDHRYLNHVYAKLVAVIHAKLATLKALGTSYQDSALAEYDSTTFDALMAIRAEPVPEGLETFHEHVVKSIELHRAFFTEAGRRLDGRLASLRAEARDKQQLDQRWKAEFATIWSIREGREATGTLLAAWSEMQARYDQRWSPAVKDGIYHHLCALDFF